MLKITAAIILAAAVIYVLTLSGCGTALAPATTLTKAPTYTTSTSHPTTVVPPPSATEMLPASQEPIEIVSVSGPLPPINPGGPIVEISLKNVRAEPVIYLNAKLGVPGIPVNTPFSFYFQITPENPLLPGKSVSARQTLIGGGFSGSVSYPLTINGTLQDLAAFTYTKQVQITATQ